VHVVTVFIVKRSGNNRQQLAFLSVILILLQSVVLGYFSVLPLYLYGRPMCLDALHVSLLASVQSILAFLLSILTALCKKSFDSTYLAPVLGSFAVIINLVIIGLAKQIWLLYIGKIILIFILSVVYCCFSFIIIAASIGSLFFIALPVLRTKLTKLVEINEYAIVFIGAGIIETVGYSAVGAAANSIYSASINFFPGLIFILFALIGLFPIVMMWYDCC
jgi:hypothetical protein